MITFTLRFLKATKNSSSVYREKLSILKKNFTIKPIRSTCEGKKKIVASRPQLYSKLLSQWEILL